MRNNITGLIMKLSFDLSGFPVHSFLLFSRHFSCYLISLGLEVPMETMGSPRSFSTDSNLDKVNVPLLGDVEVERRRKNKGWAYQN